VVGPLGSILNMTSNIRQFLDCVSLYCVVTFLLIAFFCWLGIMASSSDVLVEHIAGEFTEIALCSICTEVFTNPRLLECRHTFCLECLEKYAEEKHCGQTVACPICRQPSVIPTGGMVNLERNRDMERLVETSRRVESRLKEGLSHCEEHAGKPVMLYCETCSCPVCSRCITGNHSGHRFQETKTAAEDSLKRLETRLGLTVSKSLGKLQEKLGHINRAISVRQKAADEGRAKVFDHYKEIEALIVANRRSLVSELHAATKELQELKGQTSNFIEKLQELRNLAEDKSFQPLDVISQCAELLLLPVEDVLQTEVDETSLSFERNFKLFKLESKAVNLLGNVSCVPVKKQEQKGTGTLTVEFMLTDVSLIVVALCNRADHNIFIL